VLPMELAKLKAAVRRSASRLAESPLPYLEDTELPPPEATSERFLDVLL
jgi:hypothetical protein